ncbi:MAG TPA: hypothetical protein VFC37_06320 [Terracidiphilus sp.]|nr:hypothetical protein [Terracidiphilus sp.]
MAMTIIQSTHPEWFGNHPWILPVSLLLIFAGLLFWLTQIGWIQRILGLSKVETSHVDLPNAKPQMESRLKIISSYYGVEGGPDEEVTEKYLKPRMAGDSLVGWVGADLFGPFQPVTGLLKRLKVRYSFNGKEATVTRPEHAILILPEDSFLTRQLDEIKQMHADEMRRHEITHNAELSRSHEFYEQCKEEKRAIEAKVDSLSPLQIDALTLSTRLLQFIEAQGPPPIPKYTREQLDAMSSERWKALVQSGDKDFDFACEYYYGGNLDRTTPESRDEVHKQMNARAMLLHSWYQKIRAAYNLNFKKKVEEMYHRFVLEELAEQVLLVPDGIGMRKEDVLAIANKLWELAYKLREKGVVIETP